MFDAYLSFFVPRAIPCIKKNSTDNPSVLFIFASRPTLTISH